MLAYPSSQRCVWPSECSGEGPFLQPTNLPELDRDFQQHLGLVVRPDTTDNNTSQPPVLPTCRAMHRRLEPRQTGSVDEQSQNDNLQESSQEQPNQPTVVPSQRAVLIRRKKRMHTDDEWETVKPVLYELYMEQCLTLERVIQIMSQEHNFHAT